MLRELCSFHSVQCLSRFTLCLSRFTLCISRFTLCISGFHSVLISFGTGGELPAEAKTVSA